MIYNHNADIEKIKNKIAKKEDKIQHEVLNLPKVEKLQHLAYPKILKKIILKTFNKSDEFNVERLEIDDDDESNVVDMFLGKSYFKFNIHQFYHHRNCH